MPENTKKFLWLAASVSLFALVVVGAAFIFFAPAKTSRLAPFDLNGKAEPKQESPQDYLADAPADAGTTQTTSSSGDIIIVYGNNPDAKSGEAPAESQQKPATTTIIVTPSATTTPRQAETPKASPPVPAAKPAVQPSAKAPAAKTAAATPKAAPAPAASTKPPAVAAKTTAAQPAGADYWIQAGSFSVKDNADALKNSFKDKGLPTSLTVRDTDGKSRYLVKIGPYPTREEANKWLPAVKSVKGAEKAWITQ